MDESANTHHEIDREIEDDAPVPALEPDVESRVRALLADTPDPGPMPDEVSARISAALLETARRRVDPGPLSGVPRATEPYDPASARGAGTVVPMPSRAVRPTPIYLAAAVAAAAVVVVAGASALHVIKRPNGAALVGGFSSPSRTAPTPATRATPATPATPATAASPHIQLSTTAYTSDNLGDRARRLLDAPGPPLRTLAAESPGIGPIGTPVGLRSCLEAIKAVRSSGPAPEAVSADLATFDGRPAVVVVVTRAGASTAWAVERSCTTGAPGILHEATPVP